MTNRAILTTFVGLVAAFAAAPAGATHPELACGHFALTEPVTLPRDAFVLRTITLRAEDVVLDGECVSKRARVRRRDSGGARFVAIFTECGSARFIKIRGTTDATCSAMRGHLVSRGPRFHTAFTAVATSEHDCGAAGVCAPDEFCEAPVGTCVADHGGACTTRPTACPDIFLPVCGCDGITYGNDCERRATGVSKLYDGACEVPGCANNGDCVADEYCAKRAGNCDGLGACAPRPDLCPLALIPTCGCDGQTYGNPCEAAAAGVNVAHEGACELRCDGFAGISCPDGYVCDAEPGMCDVLDLGGTCVPKPDACPEIYAPVCGCDGITYGNDCERIAAGAQKDREGPCECPEILCPPDTIPVDTDHDGCIDDCISARCETNADCPEDRWCNNEFTFGDCAGPGICAERPLGCPDVWQPVCGCDGSTYSNDCDAAAAGVRVAHAGSCLCEPPICLDGQPAIDTDGDGCPDRCPPGDLCGTIVGLGCPDGQVCDLAPSTCLTADAPGICVDKPEVCPEIYAPVCGCDGTTYGNDCERLAAGATKDHDGECGGTCGRCPEGFFPIPGPDGCPIACLGPPCETKCTSDTCTITCTALEPV